VALIPHTAGTSLHGDVVGHPHLVKMTRYLLAAMGAPSMRSRFGLAIAHGTAPPLEVLTVRCSGGSNALHLQELAWLEVR